MSRAQVISLSGCQQAPNMCQKLPKSNCEEYSGGRWYVFQELSCQYEKKKKRKHELRQIMNQKVKIFLLYCSNKCILRTKESKCLESRRDCGSSLCRKTSMQRKPGNHSAAETHAFAAAETAKQLAYFKKIRW